MGVVFNRKSCICIGAFADRIVYKSYENTFNSIFTSVKASNAKIRIKIMLYF